MSCQCQSLASWNGCWQWIPTAPPRRGVTDGSVAAPGMIGEIIGMAGSVAFPANALTTTLTTMGTLPAGDWDMQATFDLTGTLNNGFVLDNVPSTNLNLTIAQQNALLPPGMSWIGVELRISTGQEISLFTRTGFYRGAKAVPIILRTVIDGPTASGTAQIGFLARRMR